MTGRPMTWTDADLVEAVGASSSKAEVYRRLGLRGGSATVRRRIVELGLGDRFTPTEMPKPVPPRRNRYGVDWEKMPKLGTPGGRRRSLRMVGAAMLYHGALYECARCGNVGEKDGRVFELKARRLNGKHWDNRMENLEFLCGDCHE